ncbi:hypothetical protein XI09_42225 [Bradyrhizobium sp. CCBAU 11386]|uniref:DUF1833 family protein n=1 Tax=Bradyrhizobium sp. CCBAU 11386 TaxID=1630837 RepID=UPI0023041334|nr:DUF1833 family protein [Bradyrhizobium sp. CCBAU 11386]MDA9511161.1 hypothetical protein [Bradyrhizobium sp. CCBAU 11386]
MRVLSLNFRQALFSQESGEVPIFLLTITHAELEDPIYLTTDPTSRLSEDPLIYATTSRGVEFLYAGVDVTLPDEQDKAPPASKLTIANVTRELIPLARSVSTPPSVKIEAVLASAPDDVEMIWPAMDMSNLTYDASFLQFDLTMDSLVTEPYPSGTFSPAYFPGLFS